MLRVVPLLLLSCLTEAAFLDEFDPAAAVKGLPGAMRDNFRIFRVGIGAMWNNRQAAGAVRKRLAQGCEPVAYPDLLLMRKSADDSQKLLQAGLIYLVMPEVLPAMLYFFPSSLPSTFETDKGRAKRHDTLVRLRAKAVLQLACQIEEDAATKTGKKGLLSAALCSKAEAVLKGASAARAVAPLAAYLPPPADAKEACEVAKAPLKGLPGPFIKAGCTLIGLSGPLPGPIRRQPLSPLAPRSFGASRTTPEPAPSAACTRSAACPHRGPRSPAGSRCGSTCRTWRRRTLRCARADSRASAGPNCSRRPSTEASGRPLRATRSCARSSLTGSPCSIS